MKRLLFKNILFLLIVALLLGCTGCATKKGSSKKKRPHNTRRSNHANREYDDPLFDTIFQKRSDRPKYMRNVNLSEEDRRLVDKTFGSPEQRRSDPDLENMRRNMRSNDTQRSDWVFGTKNGNLF